MMQSVVLIFFIYTLLDHFLHYNSLRSKWETEQVSKEETGWKKCVLFDIFLQLEEVVVIQGVYYNRQAVLNQTTGYFKILSL